MRNLFRLIIIFSILSCKGQDEKGNLSKAKDLVRQSNKLYLKSNLEKNVKLDSCIVLINEAIKIDENYFDAYLTKSRFLTEKKDISELLKNNEKMILLRPTQPYWKIQRGLYFDLIGNSTDAEKNYDEAIKEYQNLFQTEQKNNFDLRMEYLTALELKEDIKSAEKELEKLSQEFPKNESLKLYKAEYKFQTKKDLLALWETISAN